MKHFHFYIYLTQNIINGHKYIGKRKCACEIDDDKYLGSGTILKNAIKKYGVQNFSKTILEICSSESECNEREKYWIAKYDATNNQDFYNIATGGNGGNTYAGLSPDELDRIRSIKRRQTAGANNPRYGALVTEETRSKMSAALKQLYSNPVNCPRYGKYGKDNPCSKRILCIELEKEFDGVREASRQMNIPSPNIARSLRDPNRFSAGKRDGIRLHWKYCEE